MKWGARWSHVRAVCILLAVLVHGTAAAPMPRSIKRSQFDTVIAQEEMDKWVRILGGVGIAITRDDLSNKTFAFGKIFADLRSFLLTPFKETFRITGTGQGWGLFTYPDSYPHQLVVEVRSAEGDAEGEGEWRPIYAALDPDHDWMRAQLAYRRVRGVYDGNTRKPGASYDNFVAWIGGLALTAHPDAAEVRVGFIRTHTIMPGETPDPERLPRFQRTVSR